MILSSNETQPSSEGRANTRVVACEVSNCQRSQHRQKTGDGGLARPHIYSFSDPATRISTPRPLIEKLKDGFRASRRMTAAEAQIERAIRQAPMKVSLSIRPLTEGESEALL